ncbi:hypothetical protein MUP01_03870 [Candidatus Bathyarchaeota archaeon]|nr:hypothetical protein [Candidatus Bathyarchaeota archaeon]
MGLEGTILGLAQQLMSFIIPEIIFLIFVEKSGNRFKFRFSEIEDYPGLKSFAKTWMVGIVAFVIYLLSPSIFEFFLGSTVNNWLTSLSLLKLGSLTVALSGFTLFFIVNYLFEKKMEMDKYTIIVGAITVVSFAFFLS